MTDSTFGNGQCGVVCAPQLDLAGGVLGWLARDGVNGRQCRSRGRICAPCCKAAPSWLVAFGER